MKYILLILMLVSVPANAEWKTYGVGNDTCETFSHKWDSGNKDDYISFTAGYMTVVNEISEEKEAIEMEPDVLAYYVRRVCRTERRKHQVFVTVLSLTMKSIAEEKNPNLLALWWRAE